MGLDFSYLEGANKKAGKILSHVEKTDIARWLDLTRWAKFDDTKKQFYYKGIMGSTKVYVLSAMEWMPEIAKPEGGVYGVNDYRITVLWENKTYEIRFRNFQAHTNNPLPGFKSEALTKQGNYVYQWMGYTVTGIHHVEVSPTMDKCIFDSLWMALAS